MQQIVCGLCRAPLSFTTTSDDGTDHTVGTCATHGVRFDRYDRGMLEVEQVRLSLTGVPDGLGPLTDGEHAG